MFLDFSSKILPRKLFSVSIHVS